MPPVRSRPFWQAAEPVTAMITAYTGRFAPSPSGPLHFGSLVAALGSYLQARACQGRWLVRIEDLDPPRETAGAARHILQQLEHYGLCWDGEVLWQSQRHQAYREILNLLQQRQQSYFCTCARRGIQQESGYYTGHCRRLQQGPAGAAQRLKVDRPVYQFDDQLRGLITAEPALAEEDFIIHRRDGLFAYNLAVVVDDHHQGVTEVMRGADLITPTVRQITLYQQLGWTPPRWLHLPLVLNGNGNKLSKQNHAPALPPGDPRLTLCQALRFLGQSVPDGIADMTPETLLACAVAHWEIRKIPLSDADGPDVTTTAFSNDSH